MRLLMSLNNHTKNQPVCSMTSSLTSIMNVWGWGQGEPSSVRWQAPGSYCARQLWASMKISWARSANSFVENWGSYSLILRILLETKQTKKKNFNILGSDSLNSVMKDLRKSLEQEKQEVQKDSYASCDAALCRNCSVRCFRPSLDKLERRASPSGGM